MVSINQIMYLQFLQHLVNFLISQMQQLHHFFDCKNDKYSSSTDYLLCRTELREHTNKSVSELHLNDDAVQILTDEKYNPRLLSELLFYESLHKFMTDLEIYIDGFNDKGIQIANAFPDVIRYKLN